MLGFAVRRLGVSILVLFAVSALSFALLKTSGDLAISLAGEASGSNYVEFLRKEYGLDQPLPVQYGEWLLKTLTGDFGRSYYFNQPVADLLATRLSVTLSLGGMAIAIAMGLSLPLGVLAALRPGGWLDKLVLSIALVGQATPIFWFSFLLILALGLNLAILPISGGGSIQHLMMPAMALAFNAMPALIRIVRVGMIDALSSDYVRTARAKGLRSRTVIVKHALRNALVPLVAIAAVQCGFLLGGSVVVETIFALDGLGYFAYRAISQNDYPVVQAVVLLVSSFYVLLTFLADLLNMVIDPRLRQQPR